MKALEKYRISQRCFYQAIVLFSFCFYSFFPFFWVCALLQTVSTRAAEYCAFYVHPHRMHTTLCIHYSTTNVNLLLARNNMKQEFNHKLLSSVCEQRTSSSVWHSLVHILNTLRKINYFDAISKLFTPNNIHCDEFH